MNRRKGIIRCLCAVIWGLDYDLRGQETTGTTTNFKIAGNEPIPVFLDLNMKYLEVRYKGESIKFTPEEIMESLKEKK